MKTKKKQTDWLEPFFGQRILISICCNNVDNGQFTGLAVSVEICGRIHDITFDGRFADAWARLSVGEDTITLCGIKIKFSGYEHWRGNWCWDAWLVERRDVARLLASKCFAKWFSPESGCSRLWDAWEERKAKS